MFNSVKGCGRLRPMDATSPVVIATPAVMHSGGNCTTPQPHARKNPSHKLGAVGDDALPSNIVFRGPTPLKDTKSPIDASNAQSLMDQFDRQIKAQSARDSPRPTRVEQIVRAAFSVNNLRGTLEDVKRAYVNHGFDVTSTTSPSTNEDNVSRLARIVGGGHPTGASSTGRATVSPMAIPQCTTPHPSCFSANLDKEIAATFYADPNNIQPVMPKKTIQAPKPSMQLQSVHLEQSQTAYKQPRRRIKRSTESAFSDATTEASTQAATVDVTNVVPN